MLGIAPERKKHSPLFALDLFVQEDIQRVSILRMSDFVELLRGIYSGAQAQREASTSMFRQMADEDPDQLVTLLLETMENVPDVEVRHSPPFTSISLDNTLPAPLGSHHLAIFYFVRTEMSQSTVLRMPATPILGSYCIHSPWTLNSISNSSSRRFLDVQEAKYLKRRSSKFSLLSICSI